jgi:hypothetical protein
VTAKLLQGLVRQARKNRLVYLILAEGRLVLPEAQAPQPDHNVHDGAHNRGWRASSAGEARVSRVALGVLWALRQVALVALASEVQRSLIARIP